MDPIKAEKLQATDGYNWNQYHSFLRTLIRCTLALLFFALFLSSLLWLSKLYSSLKYLLFVTLPSIRVAVLRPKCVFVICNVIIIFILGESMLSTSKGPTAPDIYEEYVEMKKRLQRIPQIGSSEPMEVIPVQVVEEAPNARELEQEEEPAVMELEKQKLVEDDAEKNDDIEEVKEVEEVEEEEVVREEAKEKNGEQEQTTQELVCCGEEEDVIGVGEDEDVGIPVDELNSRVEAFIAMVKDQRRMEARMLMCRA